jgi:hypothetical protein
LAFRNSTFTSVRLLLISWARKMKNLLHLRTDTSYFWVFTSTSLPLFLKSFNRLGFASVGIVISVIYSSCQRKRILKRIFKSGTMTKEKWEMGLERMKQQREKISRATCKFSQTMAVVKNVSMMTHTIISQFVIVKAKSKPIFHVGMSEKI